MSAPANLRKSMPLVAAFVDDMREAFGADVINPQIRRGMAGEIGFWASENGVEIGTEIIFDYVDKYQRPTIIAINQLDHEKANFQSTLEEAKKFF